MAASAHAPLTHGRERRGGRHLNGRTIATFERGIRPAGRRRKCLCVVPRHGTVIDMGRGVASAPFTAAASTLAALLAAGAAVPAEAHLPTKLIVVCSPKVRCTDRTKQLHRVQIGVQYRLQLPISEPTSVNSGKRKTIRQALRFRTREIRSKESERVMFYADVALSPSSAMGGFVGTRTLRLSEVQRRKEPIACTLSVTVCSDPLLAALGVAPSRRAKLCARALRRLRRRVGIIEVTTPPATFTVDSCPQPKPPKTTTTRTTSTTTTSSTSSSMSTTTTTTMP